MLLIMLIMLIMLINYQCECVEMKINTYEDSNYKSLCSRQKNRMILRKKKTESHIIHTLIILIIK